MNGIFLCLRLSPSLLFLPLGLPHGTGEVYLNGVIHDLVHHFEPSELPDGIAPDSFEAELLALGVYAYGLPHNDDWLYAVEREVEALIENMQRPLIDLPHQITVPMLGLINEQAYHWLIYGYTMAKAKYPELKGELEKHRTGMAEGLEHHHFEINHAYLFEPNVYTADCEVTHYSVNQLRITT